MDTTEMLAQTGKATSAPERPGHSSTGAPRKKASSRATVRISVIIPAHNEEAYLPHTLDALRRQKYPACEIIVVANGCTDRTTEVAGARCDRLIVLSEKGLGVARNLGARMATGDLFVFLDADTILQRNALRTIAESFSRGDAAGTVRGKPNLNRLPYRLIYLWKNFVHRFALHAGSSGVIICWKKDFIRIGGFNERLEVCENSELIQRLRRFGRYKYFADTAAVTSMRRYERRGMRHMAWMWTRVWLTSLFRDLHGRKYEAVR